MQAMFWTRGPNTIQTLFELDENKRNGEDQWLAGFLAECCAGNLCWENYNFMHGYATQAPGSWMSGTDALQCGKERCLELWKETWPEMRRRGIDWSLAQRLECDACNEERARRGRLLSTVTARAEPARRAILNTAPYIHPCNWPKYQATQKRAVLFAQAQGSQILWIRAVDCPNTVSYTHLTLPTKA